MAAPQHSLARMAAAIVALQRRFDLFEESVTEALLQLADSDQAPDQDVAAPPEPDLLDFFDTAATDPTVARLIERVGRLTKRAPPPATPLATPLAPGAGLAPAPPKQET